MASRPGRAGPSPTRMTWARSPIAPTGRRAPDGTRAVMIIGELAVAGAVGAVLRYLVDHLVQHRLAPGRAGPEFPLGTMAVNVSGSFALGLLVGSGLHHGVSATWVTVGGTGLIGSYTTFSTFTFDTVRLAGDGRRATAALNVMTSLAFGLGAAAVGLALGSLT